MIFPYDAAGDMVKYHMIRLGTENSLGIGSMVVGGAEQHWINNHVRHWQGCVVQFGSGPPQNIPLLVLYTF